MYEHIQYSHNVHYCVWAQEVAIVGEWYYSNVHGHYFICERCKSGVKVLGGKSARKVPKLGVPVLFRQEQAFRLVRDADEVMA